ncbi:MAG: putative toxin-antitoxin system toxin component, PIN family [Thermoplasmata archaeon]|nr:putative toxin-antitoxin system toxin component, PIN family [Thermoplasmata archaeon]NIS10418.1 putative toxin-antitoxin system toxin component, PIN family [Thermoplasmata archaeon]
MRVVLDTNVLVSAHLWKGNEWVVLGLCRRGDLLSVTSPFILSELERVLNQKFKEADGEVSQYITELVTMSDIVIPAGNLSVIDFDPDDDIVLETALVGHADAIITGDSHLLEVRTFKNVDILNARRFLRNIQRDVSKEDGK